MLNAPTKPALEQIRALTSDALLSQLHDWSSQPEPIKVADLDSDTEFTYVTPSTHFDALQVT